VRNLLHNQVFTGKSTEELKKEDKIEHKKQKMGFFLTNQGRGFLAFLVSGAFHELIICSVCRKLTLENFSFFTLHGFACMLEVKYFSQNKKQDPPKGLARVGRIVAQLGFMTLTGRLFLAPFLRHRFTEILPLTQF
jgi:hypothetical protein